MFWFFFILLFIIISTVVALFMARDEKKTDFDFHKDEKPKEKKENKVKETDKRITVDEDRKKDTKPRNNENRNAIEASRDSKKSRLLSAPKQENYEKIVLNDVDSLIGEKGILYSYCIENSKRLGTSRINSINSSISFIRDNPEFANELIKRINNLDPINYELTLDVAIKELEINPDNMEMNAIKDVLFACTYFSGVNKEKDDFICREKAVSGESFMDEFDDELFRAEAKVPTKTSHESTDRISPDTEVSIDIDKLIGETFGKKSAIQSLRENIRTIFPKKARTGA